MSTDPILAPFASRDAATGIIYVDARGFFGTHIGRDLLMYMVKEGYLEKWHVRALFGYERVVFAVFFMSTPKRGPYASRSRCEAGVQLFFQQEYDSWKDKDARPDDMPKIEDYYCDTQHQPKRRKVESD